MTADLSQAKGWRFDNSYARLPDVFFARQPPVPVAEPKIVIFNYTLAAELGLSAAENAAVLSGNQLPDGADPLAQAYAGHQFGHFTMLGDGRAVLLGEHLTPDGHRYDIQLKGSGRTPFSRNGDGRAALGPMLREYIISEAMHHLGIPTTRSLAVVTTGETLQRDSVQPGAILTRVASSHLRVGTFEYAAMRQDRAALKTLADYTIQRHYGELQDASQPYLELLKAVIARQAELIAHWLRVGFIHGVMNTDNMTLSGETIDYGPCAFVDDYDPMAVFSSIDHQGRYAFSNQPLIAQWNLARFAETLLPLLHDDINQAVAVAEAALADFPDMLRRHWLRVMGHKLGLFKLQPGDDTLITSLLSLMHEHQADYTNNFRTLAEDQLPAEPLFLDTRFLAWQQQWQARLADQPQTQSKAQALIRTASPTIIPRNHQVESVLRAAEQGDLKPLHILLSALVKPYDDSTAYDSYHAPPTETERVRQTFCGT